MADTKLTKNEEPARYEDSRMLPPVAKITSRTVGYDFLYLRDWGT